MRWLRTVVVVACLPGLFWAVEAEEKPSVNNIVTDLILGQIVNIYAPTSKVVQNEECRKHSLFYKDAAEKKLLWALKMLDSSSKLPSGMLAGNLVDLGNFDECLEVEDVATPSGRFSGQYCMASLRPGGGARKAPPYDGNPWTVLHEALRVGPTNKSGGGSSLPLSVKLAVCVPSSCSPHDLELHLQNVLPGLMGSVAVTVSKTACSSRANPKEFSAADWFAVGFVAFFAALIILSTAYDLASSKTGPRHALLISFSVYTNGGKLLKSPSTSSDTLQAVHGVRFLSMAWVVLGHTYMIFALLLPNVNFFKIAEYMRDWEHIFVTNATVSVDSFFLLSGLLVCYLFLKEMEKGTSFNVPLYYLHRYIRLTPAYAVMLLLTATLFVHMGNGPNWDRNLSAVQVFCQENWWANLLYINNYYEPERVCLGQSWYLAVDMQLFWLSPLILYPLWKWPKFGKLLWVILLVAGLIIAFLVPYINEFPFSPIGGAGGTQAKQYVPVHTRYMPWLIGVGLGYLLHSAKRNQLQLSPVYVAAGWLLSAGLMLASLLVAHTFTQPEYTYNRVLDSLYTCLMRPAWALGLAWVIFACTTGYGGFVNTFLSWRFFQVMGRFTYTIYLTHMSTMLAVASISRTPGNITNGTMMMEFFSELILSIFAAFVLSVTFESPAIAIERSLLSKPAGKGKKQSLNTKSVDIKELIANNGDLNHNVQENSAVMEDLENGMPAKKKDLENVLPAKKEDFENVLLAKKEDFENVLPAKKEDFENVLPAKKKDLENVLPAKKKDLENVLPAKKEDFENVLPAKKEDLEDELPANISLSLQ